MPNVIPFHWSWEAQNSFCFCNCSTGRPSLCLGSPLQYSNNIKYTKMLHMLHFHSSFQGYPTCLYQILLFEFTIVASRGYMRAFQMSNFKNKNCSELLLTNGMGLDGAPIKFLTFKISPLKVRPPNVHIQCILYISQQVV